VLSGPDFVVVGLAALAAGLVNALAGGGTLISFPVMTAVGLPAVSANVTNTVALCPGFLGGILAQARDLRGQEARLWRAVPAGAIGGLAGGWLLLNTGEQVFQALVPYLILVACGLLAIQAPMRGWLVEQMARRRATGPHRGDENRAGLLIGAAAVYGGYFGAGLGVILLATVGLILEDTLTRLNALKQAVALSTNLAAALFFLFSDQVVWPVALIMAVGALAGGALGGRVAGRVKPDTLRLIVIAIGLIAAAFYWLRA
jgi:uncharacterized membrane protein YfcA